MRASVLLIGVFFLSACSSPPMSSNTNPEAANVTGRSSPTTATGEKLTLRFEQRSSRHILNGDPEKMTCVTSATPKEFSLAEGQEQTKVDIVGDAQGQCKDAGREVDVNLRFLPVRGTGNWFGDLDIWYSPQSGWTGELKGTGFGGVELCTFPDLTKRVALTDNQVIQFGPCS